MINTKPQMTYNGATFNAILHMQLECGWVTTESVLTTDGLGKNMDKYGLKLWQCFTVSLKCLFYFGNLSKPTEGTYTVCTKYSKKFVVFYFGSFWQEQMELFSFFSPLVPCAQAIIMLITSTVPAVQLLALLSFFILVNAALPDSGSYWNARCAQGFALY